MLTIEEVEEDRDTIKDDIEVETKADVMSLRGVC
mgnify:CR=1 FL=1